VRTVANKYSTMPITPKFELSQTPTHVVVDVRVPHVRVSPDAVQVVLTASERLCDGGDDDKAVPLADGVGGGGGDDASSARHNSAALASVLHFASPPYLLVLDFGALDGSDYDDGSAVRYRFHPDAEEESCATYRPTIRDGTITLRLRKAEEGRHWKDLDLLGRLVVAGRARTRTKPKTTTATTATTNNNSRTVPSSSRWLKEVRDVETAVESERREEEIVDDLQQQQQYQLEQWNNGYGFYRMFRGMFEDFGGNNDDAGGGRSDNFAKELFEGPWLEDQEDEEGSLAYCGDDDGDWGGGAEECQDAFGDEGGGKVTATAKKSTTNCGQRKRRRRRRYQLENATFNEERYLQDLEIQDDYLYQCAMSMVPHWRTTTKNQEHHNSTATASPAAEADITHTGSGGDEVSGDELTSRLSEMSIAENYADEQEKGSTHFGDGFGSAEDQIVFTADERHQLATIPYPLLPSQLTCHPSCCGDDDIEARSLRPRLLLLGLVDILFAYAYDHLLTDGDPTVESAWTVSILSASLSWLDDWLGSDDNDEESVGAEQWDGAEGNDALDRQLRSVFVSSTRRSLVYPYLRNVGFATKIWRDVGAILRRGTRCVIRCLLQTRVILDKSESHYLGNKLFVDPYLVWIQQCSSSASINLEEHLRDLADRIDRYLAFDEEWLKERLDLDLIGIEKNMFAAERGNGSEEEESTASSSDESQSSDDSGEMSSSGVDSGGCGDGDGGDVVETARGDSLDPESRKTKKSFPHPFDSTQLDAQLGLGISALRIVAPPPSSSAPGAVGDEAGHRQVIIAPIVDEKTRGANPLIEEIG